MSADDASITIKSGDTLSQRTVQYNREHGTNYTWQEVAEYNNLANPHLIHPGDVITFPSAPVQPAQPAPTVSAPSVPQPQAPQPSVPTPVYSAPAVSSPLLPSPSVDRFKQNATNELVITNATTQSSKEQITPPLKKSAFVSWAQKKDGEQLTKDESNVQMIIGGAEMGLGFVGIFFTNGTQISTGAYVMADGAIVFSEGNNSKKCTPFFHFANDDRI